MGNSIICRWYVLLEKADVNVAMLLYRRVRQLDVAGLLTHRFSENAWVISLIVGEGDPGNDAQLFTNP